MAQLTDFNAIIAIGCIIKGETRHFEFISNAVAQGIKDLNLNGKAPVVFCVLTDENIEQSRARSGGNKGNKGNDGKDENNGNNGDNRNNRKKRI